MTKKITAEEMALSLTGYDEIAIEKHMGVDPYTDGERKPAKVMRALAFIHKLRVDGLSAVDAAKAANAMTFGEVSDLFEDEPVTEDGTETHPITAAGNDSEPAA